ncbi:MAG: hypothetical protein IJ583_17010, partial [Firmicutes bacterium]|nr:hypothetical protein [Bacillota bacterium]
MEKRILCLITVIFIILNNIPTFADEISDNERLAIQSQYSATVKKYILNRNTVEKVEDGLILVSALYPEYDFTEVIEEVKEDTKNIYELKKCKSIFENVPENADTMKILSE